MTRPPRADLYRATSTFMLDDGSFTVVHEGDLVRAGHALLKSHPGKFAPSEEHVRFDVVEQATAAPGEKRGH